MTVDSDAVNQEVAESEAESMTVHTTGDTSIYDLTSDFDTDIEIETLNHSTDSSSLKLEQRAKTRLLSRSHSVDDLKGQSDNPSDTPRRNSSGECPQSLFDEGTPKPSPNILLSDLDLSRYKGQQNRLSVTPTSSNSQLSPVTVQYGTVSWRPPQTKDREDNFSALLHTTAERVLTKLKSRQLDLSGNITRGQKSQRKHSLGLQPTVPRKLQPILRDGSKTPRSDSDMRSVHGDSDLGPFSAA